MRKLEDGGRTKTSAISCLASLLAFAFVGASVLFFTGPFIFGENVGWAFGLSLTAAVFASWIVGSSIQMNNEWERAIILRLGRYKRSAGPGLFFKWPVIETAITRDVRIITTDIPTQEVITKDNISVKVDAVVFLKVVDPQKTVINIRNFMYAVKQYAQTTLRNIIGQKALDELLEKRETIAQSIKEAVDAKASEWGVDITGIELQNIELPADMKRIMARQAEAEREKRGVIIASEGELEAATNLVRASKKLEESEYGYKLRELQTISDVSQDRSNTIIFAPTEALGSSVLSSGVAAKVPQDQRREVKVE